MQKQTEILFGIFFTIGSTLLLAWFAINENGRMERYALAQDAVHVENGGSLFDQNCTRCHGNNAQGTNLGPIPARGISWGRYSCHANLVRTIWGTTSK